MDGTEESPRLRAGTGPAIVLPDGALKRIGKCFAEMHMNRCSWQKP